LEPAAREVLDGHKLGGLSLLEFLQPLDFESCMTTVRDDLVSGLNRLRALHISSSESRGSRATWKAWNPLLENLSPDAVVLLSTWLDSPETARRLFFCEDGLPASWKSLAPDAYVVEAVTWFDIEVADAEHALHKGSPGDREQAVMSLMELQAALTDRFDTSFSAGPESEASRSRLERRLGLMWSTLVEPYHYGFTPKARTTTQIAESGADGYLPASPFTPGGVGIPDPRDVALRDRVARGWRRQRQTIDREIEDRQGRLDEAVAAIDSTQGSQQLNKLVRQAIRLDAELAQSVADLERLQSRVRGLRTGRPWVDDMLSNGYRRRAVRRLDRREASVLRQRDAVRSVIERAVENGAESPDELLRGDRSTLLSSSQEGNATAGPGNWLAGLPESEGAQGGSDHQNTIPEGSGAVQRSYEGPLPPPSKVWSADLVQAIQRRHPRLDEDDVRILLGLVREAYSELRGRPAIEEALWRTLAGPGGLSLGGEEATLSDLYLPGETRAEQPIITFVLTLRF